MITLEKHGVRNYAVYHEEEGRIAMLDTEEWDIEWRATDWIPTKDLCTLVDKITELRRELGDEV